MAKIYTIEDDIIYRISGGKYPTLYVSEAEDHNPLKIKRTVQLPIPQKFARCQEDIEDGIKRAKEILSKTQPEP